MSECKHCGQCCTYAKFLIPDDKQGKDQAKWCQLHGCRTVSNGKQIQVVIPIVCAYLVFNGTTKKYSCADYDNRPQVCRDYNCKKP